MQILANDRMVAHQPALHPSSLEIVVDKIRFKAFDLAGHETGRRLWKEYFAIADAMFFLVDAADRSRFPEAAEELKGLIAEHSLKTKPIAVVGMKIDLKDAASEDEFCEAMGLSPEVREDKVKVFMCSAIEMGGCHQIGEAVLWLSKHILQRRSDERAAAATDAVVVGAGADPDDDLMV